MRASIVIASHNEGELLWKTVQSCVESTEGLDVEFVIADDASDDGCVKEARRRFPFIRTSRHRRRRGASATKDLAARKARGDVLIFLDGHCQPEPWAIERLIIDVEELAGRFVVTPSVPQLDPRIWRNIHTQVGYGYSVQLDRLTCGWIGRDEMRRHGRFYESPSLCGCCVAMSRQLYRDLQGFDRHMIDWGVEDIDLALKAWLFGNGVLHDPDACIGHRFRNRFDTFTVRDVAIPVNQLRMARKNFSDEVWKEFLERFRKRESDDWERIWELFSRGQRSLERERSRLFKIRQRDEFWYAARFGLPWPCAR